MGKALKIFLVAAVSIIALIVIVSVAAVSTSKTPNGVIASPSPANAAPVTQTATPPSPPPAPAGPATTFGDGTYLVGTDVVAGSYKTTGASPGCYWQLEKNLSGDYSALVKNGFSQGPDRATLAAGQYFNTSGGCTWVKQ
jgi:hypothetical protein